MIPFNAMSWLRSTETDYAFRPTVGGIAKTLPLVDEMTEIHIRHDRDQFFEARGDIAEKALMMRSMPGATVHTAGATHVYSRPTAIGRIALMLTTPPRLSPFDSSSLNRGLLAEDIRALPEIYKVARFLDAVRDGNVTAGQ